MPLGTGLGAWNNHVQMESTRGKKKAEFRANVAPKAGYLPPDALAPFAHLPRIGYDLETFDPDLKTKGPGAHRVDEFGHPMGFITGAAIAYTKDTSKYYPTRHAGLNMADPENFWANLRYEASKFTGELVGTNLQYDLDWSWKERGVKFPNAKLRDIQIAEPLLDENRFSYGLNLLGKEYVGEGKYTDTLLDLYGPGYIENMHNVDAGHAADYAGQDTTLPWQVLDEQYKGLESQGLTELFHLESRLTPLLVRMRQDGVKVDLDAADQSYEMTKKVASDTENKIREIAGFTVEIWSAESIARAFDKQSMPYPRTKPSKSHPKGQPSFRKEWLEAHPSDLAHLIVEQRGYQKIGGTFIHNYILEGHMNGRIHSMFNQLKSDGGGTVSGRFSSSFPNLQNIPVRHPQLGPLCRSIFIPEDGMLWGSADWSQIEYRFLVHYAVLLQAAGAIDAQRMYEEDSKTDFHKLASEISGVPRKEAKAINFGVVYGMGVPTMANNLRVSLDEARSVLGTFHTEMPFMKSTYDTASNQAALNGEIRTILNRRRRFIDWEFKVTPKKGGQKYNVYAKSLEQAVEKQEEFLRVGDYVTVPRRAFTHKALNALLQGSAADLMKKAMVEMYEAGLFDVLFPHLTVHDEMNVSVPDTNIGREAFKELTHIMETSMLLKVPVLADAKLGANWKEAH